MAWTTEAILMSHLLNVNRVVTAYRDNPVLIDGSGVGNVPVRNWVSGSLVVKKLANVNTDVDHQSVVLTLENWATLTYPNVWPFDYTVWNVGLTVIYTPGVDYAIDLPGGRIRRIAGGAITSGATVHIHYTHFLILSPITDYTADAPNGTITRVGGGLMYPDITVFVDYELSPGSDLTTLIPNAILEANDLIERRLKDAYTIASTDQGLISGSTFLSLAILTQSLGNSALSDGQPSAGARAAMWFALSASYEKSANEALKGFVTGGSFSQNIIAPNVSWAWTNP